MTTSRLIEHWLPIAQLGMESLRERTPMTPFPAPNRLHVWWARRPLVASRAAVLASLLPADSDQDQFMQVLGIHGDPVASRRRIDAAKRSGERFEGAAYTYPRAFTHVPNTAERKWLESEASKVGLRRPRLLDPTAGGGAIPFESVRLGLDTYGNDLNPVAVLIERMTLEVPARLGSPVVTRFREIAGRYLERRETELERFFPAEPIPDSIPTNYLWARTITCPHCDGLVPLSPNWKLAGDGTGVRVKPDTATRRCGFEIVAKAKDQSEGTVARGDGLCPFPDCGRPIDGDEPRVHDRRAQWRLLAHAALRGADGRGAARVLPASLPAAPSPAPGPRRCAATPGAPSPSPSTSPTMPSRARATAGPHRRPPPAAPPVRP